MAGRTILADTVESVKPLDPRLVRWARATRVFLVASVLAGAVTAVAIVAQAVLLASIITDVFQQGATLADVADQVWLLAAVIVARSALAFLMEWVAFGSAARAKSQLRMAVLDHAVALGPQYLDSRGPGELAQLTSRGIDALDAYFARYLPQLVLAAIVPAVIVIVVVTEDLLAAVIITATIPLIPVFMVLIGLYTRRQVDRQWRTLGVLSGHFLDVVAGLPTLKAFGRAKAQAATLRDIGGRYRRATMGVLRVSFLSALALELLATLSVAIVAVAVGLRLVNGDLDLYTGLLVLILAPEAYLPLRLVGAQFHAAADGIAAAEQLLDVLDQPLPPRRPAAGGAALLSGPLTLSVTGVTVAYPGRTSAALSGLTLTASPGRITALAGESGVGKSTALRTILGLTTRRAGDVTLRGERGSRRLDDTTPTDWLAQFAWLPQEPVLVPGTVADNILLGRASAARADVESAARRAGLVDGAVLDQAVADLAAGVSAGQRRRIGLARVLLRDAPVVLLDEPSAALDEVTEATVVSALAELRDHGRTVLVVAHRPALLAVADDVVHLAPTDVDVVVPLTEAEGVALLPGLSR